MENAEKQIEKKRILYALFIPSGICLMLLLVFLLEKGMDWDFHHAGVFPRKAKGFWGIFLHAFIHNNWQHLFNNMLSLFVLSAFVCYFYTPLEGKILLLSYIGCGILLWIIGRPSWHIGASGLVYALSFFLFWSGLFRRYVPLIAVSFIVVLLYGSEIWYLFPWKETQQISWEGHLAGGITGSILSVKYRHCGPQKPIIVDDEDEVEEDEFNELIT